MRCAIHQPNLLPRLSTLAKIFSADVWVVLDDVQFCRRDYQHRARLAALHDPDVQQWLTLPVHLPYGRATRIDQVRLVDPNRARRVTFRLLQHHYSRSPHWPSFRDRLDEWLPVFDHSDQLTRAAEASTLFLLDVLGWKGTVLHSSGLEARPSRSARLADLTRIARADVYVCGSGGARYLDPAPFISAGLHIDYFATPVTGPGPWDRAHHVTSLRPLMDVGAHAVRSALSRHFSSRTAIRADQ